MLILLLLLPVVIIVIMMHILISIAQLRGNTDFKNQFFLLQIVCSLIRPDFPLGFTKKKKILNKKNLMLNSHFSNEIFDTNNLFSFFERYLFI